MGIRLQLATCDIAAGNHGGYIGDGVPHRSDFEHSGVLADAVARDEPSVAAAHYRYFLLVY